MIDSFLPYEAAYAHRSDLIAHGGALYASGSSTSVQVGSIPSTWVRKSTDGGSTWTTLYEAWGAYIEDMIPWNGGIVILEDYDRGIHKGKIRVLATSNDFVNLTELVSYAPAAPDTSYAMSLTTDSRGYLYASGAFTDTGLVGTSIVAVTRDGSSWEKIVDKTSTDLVSESPDRIFVNSNNQVFYAAPSTEDGGTTNPLRLYRATINTPTTFTLAAIGNGGAKVTPIPASSKIIYVTTGLTAGNLGLTAAAAKTSADAFCNSDENKPTFATGTFKALLVVTGERIACTTANCGGGSGEHTDWPLAANQQYVTRTGLVFGTTNALGLFTSISASNHLAMYSPVLAWSGLDQSSAANYWMMDSGGNCSDWTSNNNGDFGWTLNPTQLALTDFYSDSGANWNTCDELRPLVCVEQ